MITDSEIIDIETRYKAATPSPWLVNPDPRYYVEMPFSTDEQVKLDRDANAAFVANARDDVPKLAAEVRLLQSQLHDEREHGWNPLMREIAKLSDAMGLDDGDWSEADDSTLLEQFDPWTVVTAAIEKSKKALPETELRCAICALDGGQHAPDCPLYSWHCGLCGALVSKRTEGDHARSHAALPLSTSNACLCGDWPKQSTWLHCPWCGCTLSAAQQAVCPECGFAHAPGGNTCCSR